MCGIINRVKAFIHYIRTDCIGREICCNTRKIKDTGYTVVGSFFGTQYMGSRTLKAAHIYSCKKYGRRVLIQLKEEPNKDMPKYKRFRVYAIPPKRKCKI